MIWPFGVHKGKPITDLPDNYVDWALDNLEFKSEKVHEALAAEQSRRFDKDPYGDLEDFIDGEQMY